MITERRQSPRSEPNQPVYVSFPGQNRGTVIDATENGLRFRTEAPVKHDEGAIPVRFTFSPFAEMESVCEIIWVDEENKTGGLLFKDLPGPDRSNIRRWLEQNAHPLPVRTDDVRVQAVPTETGSPNGNKSGPSAAPDVELAGATVAASAPRDPVRSGAFVPTSEFAAPWRPLAGSRSYEPDTPRHGVRRALLMTLGFGLMIVVFAALGLLLYWRAGGSTPSLAQNLLNWRWTDSQSDAQNAPASSEVSPLLRPPSKTHRIRPIGADSDGALPLSPSPGASELAIGMQYLSSGGGPAETKLAVKWLWAAVEQGNPKAAMLLAELYVWGRGVPQNCEQARVLLIGASKHGSMEAAQQLQDMEADGCASPETASK
jgi:hypothetical protein